MRAAINLCMQVITKTYEQQAEQQEAYRREASEQMKVVSGSAQPGFPGVMTHRHLTGDTSRTGVLRTPGT